MRWSGSPPGWLSDPEDPIEARSELVDSRAGGIRIDDGVAIDAKLWVVSFHSLPDPFTLHFSRDELLRFLRE